MSKPKKNTSADADLQLLRQIIQGEDSELLAAIAKRATDLELRAQDIAEVLSEAIIISQSKSARFERAIEQPVTESVRRSIERDTHYFAGLIFPVIGPAIRKYIKEALLSLVQNVNVAVESSLSPKSLLWRAQALFSGQSYYDVMLKHSLIYRVEQVFLIENESGLLMQHVARDDIKVKDSDAVSAMFSAVQSFVQDSFADGSGQQQQLDSLEVGNSTIWLTRQGNAVLACVIRGVAPNKLKENFSNLLEEIHRDYGYLLQKFNGSRQELAVIEPELRKCFAIEQAEKPTAALGKSWVARCGSWLKKPLFYILLAVFAFAIYHLAYSLQQQQRAKQLLQRLENSPGLMLSQVKWQRKKWYLPHKKLLIYGLQDGEFANAQSIVQQVYAQDAATVKLQLQPYYSLSPQLLLERLKGKIKPPTGVKLNYIAATKTVELDGEASLKWLHRQRTPVSILGIDKLDYAPLWNNMQRIERQYHQLAALLNGKELFFQYSAAAQSGFEHKIRAYAAIWRRLNFLAAKLGYSLHLKITAYSDSYGQASTNSAARAMRLEAVSNAFVKQGVNSAQIISADGGELGISSRADDSLRKVSLGIVEAQINDDN